MPRRLPRAEFIALMAMLFATIAFSIDAMLPALPEIAGELSPHTPNRAQLIITSFVLGMGVGTLFTGALADAFGRRRVILGGAAVFVAGAMIAWASSSLELVLLGRVIQGLGAAAPRVAAMAIVRDLYEGRGMARLMSFVMLVFTLVPAIAPTIGAGIIWLTGWRGIFLAFVLFSLVSASWLAIRQEETLKEENRRPFRLGLLFAGVVEVVSNKTVAISTAAQSFCFGMLFATLSSTQQVFDETFGQGDVFHLWFAGIAALAATASVLNASLVGRLGMRFMVSASLSVALVFFALCATAFASGAFSGTPALLLFFFWNSGVFFLAGMTLGNLNSIAMEPMGHLAGMTASVIGSVATVIAVVIAIPLGLAFDGTPMPLTIGVTVLCAIALGLARWLLRLERGMQPA